MRFSQAPSARVISARDTAMVSMSAMTYRLSASTGPLAALVVLLLSMLVGGAAGAADFDPAEDEALAWKLSVVPVDAKAGEEVELVFAAAVAEGWIVYASDFEAELGPRPARFTFEKSAEVELIGPVRAVNSLRRTDKTWNTEYSYFEKRAEFRQKARLLKDAATVTGRIDGQTCYETTGLCALFRKPFRLQVE
jgi:hypothetical protein